MDTRAHWESVYLSKSDDQLSWTQTEPALSLQLIEECAQPGAHVLDVGGGNSVLVDRLLARGYGVTVLDIAKPALERSRARLGQEAARVTWTAQDVTQHPAPPPCDVWHDRAVFHFLVDPDDRAKYMAALRQSVQVGGFVVIAAFSPQGPEKCSGLPVQRYSGQGLVQQIGAEFKLRKETSETHMTPWGKSQAFTYAVFTRIAL